MKHSILHSRRAPRATAFLSLVLVSLVVLTGNDARAVVTYTYSGSSQYKWSTSGSTALPVTRIGGTTALTVYANIYGSSNFTLDQSSIYWADSSQDTGAVQNLRYFGLRFSSVLDDTSTAVLILHDSHRYDTIYLTGYGPHLKDTIDYFLNWGYPTPYIMVNDSFGDTTAIATVWVENHRTASISVGAALLDSTYWSMTGNEDWTTIVPGGSRMLTITFHPHGVWHDTATVNVVCNSHYYKDTVFHIYVTDSRYAPQSYIPSLTGSDLGIVGMGDTACGPVLLTNRTTQAILIEAINFPGYGGNWSFSGLPTTPFWLAAGGSSNFSVCFVAPKKYYGAASNTIVVAWSDSSGIKGTLNASATAYAPSCFQISRDTLMLDDVIPGGYVDASVRVIVAADTGLMRADSLYVSNGSVQILSPSFPKMVYPGDTVTVTFRVAESNACNYWGYIPIRSSNCSAMISFYGRATDSTTALQLFPAQSELLDMTTSSSVTIDTFWFVNNYGGQVHVTGAQLAQGTRFTILGELPHRLPDTLTSNQSFGVIIQFDGDTNGYYHDSLTIIASQNLQTWPPYNVEAIYHKTNSNSGVSATPAISPVSLSIVPNPAEGPVTMTIANASKASIEIFDVLGNRIAVLPYALANAWDPSGMSGGLYIVRATGTDQNGNGFTISKRLILAK